MIKYFCFFVCCFGFLGFSFYGYAGTLSSYAAESKPIARIDLIVVNLPPDDFFDPHVLLAKMQTKEGGPFSQLVFDNDLKLLSEEYERVEPYLTEHDNQTILTIKLWMYPTIRSIQWEGAERIKVSTLKKEMGIQEGILFKRYLFNQSFNKLKAYYIKQGYFKAQLQYMVKPDPEELSVDILIMIDEGTAGYIRGIEFVGITPQEEDELLGKMVTRQYNLFTSWITGEGIYNDEMLEHDRLALLNQFQDWGYADVQLSIYVQESPQRDSIKLQIKVDKGPIYRLNKIHFVGNEVFSNEMLDPLFLVRPGDFYSPDKLRQTAQAIKTYYGQQGYIECQVDYEVRPIESRPECNILFKIDEGRVFKIGLIRIFGNRQTESHVILRESLLVPGENFDSARLRDTQEKLERVGLFKTVNVYAVRSLDDNFLGDNYRDVYIEVEERSTGSFSLSLGLSSSDSLFAGLELSEQNFNGAGITKLFSKGLGALRGGGEFAQLKANIGISQQVYSFSWMTPYFHDTLWRVGFDLYDSYSHQISHSYKLNTLGGSVFASYPLSRSWTFGSKFRVKDGRVHVNKEENKAALDGGDSNGFIMGASVSMTFDTTDNAIKPHRGLRSFSECEYAGFGAIATFLRLGFQNALYVPLWAKGTMKYRFDLRFLQPMGATGTPDDIPLTERFFLGGENSVRGYKAFSLGPHAPNNGPPLGGVSSGLASLEYLQAVVPMADLFVFIDAGSVSLGAFDLGRIQMSYGVGARLNILGQAPILIGYGIPINPHSEDDQQRFFFSMGTQF